MPERRALVSVPDRDLRHRSDGRRRATVAEMEAATWTAIGVLAATSLGTLFYLGARIDALGARMDARIDSLEGRMDARIDALSGRIDALSGRIDSFESRVDSRFDNLEVRLDAHVERHAG